VGKPYKSKKKSLNLLAADQHMKCYFLGLKVFFDNNNKWSMLSERRLVIKITSYLISCHKNINLHSSYENFISI